jgi:threonyl-tRNA synthetase
MIIVGDKEKEAGNISVRHRSLGDLGNMELAEFAGKAKQEALSKSLESAFVRS